MGKYTKREKTAHLLGLWMEENGYTMVGDSSRFISPLDGKYICVSALIAIYYATISRRYIDPKRCAVEIFTAYENDYWAAVDREERVS